VNTRTDRRSQLAVVAPVDHAVYTVREVSVLLALSVGNTYALVREGTIPAIRLGRRWVIPRQRFHEWINQIASSGLAPPPTGTEGRWGS
jgi:excisionase family DNA binding protein